MEQVLTNFLQSEFGKCSLIILLSITMIMVGLEE